MTRLRRKIVAISFFAMTFASVAHCAAKATREQIAELAEKCKRDEVRMDLVAEFGVDFSNLDLSGIDFRGRHSVGLETNLRRANFSNCDLRRAEFGAAVLDGADFTGADLEGATFVTASLRQAVFVRANLKGTLFRESDLSGAKLQGADLSSADITGSSFGGADLSDAVLSGAKNDYRGRDFGRANLARANLSGLMLVGAHFEDADLRSADLSRADLTQADFRRADLTGASFADAQVESAGFHDAKGLDDAERARLEGQARRWVFVLKNVFSALLEAMDFPAYAVVVVATVVLSSHALRIPDRPRSVSLAAVVNLLAFVASLSPFGLILLGASPTVQFNVGSATAMELWSAWVGLWPLLMLLLLSCLAAAAVALLVFATSCWKGTSPRPARPLLAYMVLTLTHCLFAVHRVATFFPSA